MNRVILVVLGIVLAMPAAAQPPSDKDRAVYDSAVGTLVTFAQTGLEGDTELALYTSFHLLKESKSRDADAFITRLATFRMDGAIAEDFSCVASSRGHRLSELLKDQLHHFESRNACVLAAADEGVLRDRLCMTRSEFVRLVAAYRDLPAKDDEAGCTHSLSAR